MMQSQALVEESLQRIRWRISANIDEKGLKATGRTQQSMVVEMREGGGRLMGRTDFADLEEGTPPNTHENNMVDFREAIKEWIVAKGLTVTKRGNESDQSALNSAAFLVARKIEEEGTRTYRQGGRRDIYSEVLEQEVTELKRRLTIEVKEWLQTQLRLT